MVTIVTYVCVYVYGGRRVKAGLGRRREVQEEGRRAVTRWEDSLRSKGTDADADNLTRSDERKALVKLEALLKARHTVN